MGVSGSSADICPGNSGNGDVYDGEWKDGKFFLED